MPEININAPNFSGLASLAGTRVGNLGLAVPKYGPDTNASDFMSGIAGGLAGLSKNLQGNKDREMQQQQFNATLADRQQARQQSMELAKKDEDRQQKLFDLQVNKAAMQAAKEEKAEKVQATYTASMMITQTSPEDWDQHKVEIMGGMVKSGLLDENQAKDLITQPYNQIVRQAKAMAVISNKAKEYQEMFGEGGDKKSKGTGDQTALSAIPGAPTFMKPTTPNLTATQKSISDADETLQSLQQMNQGFQKDFVGAQGMLKSTSYGVRDWLSNIPVVGGMAALNDQERDWLQKQSAFASNANALSLSYIKQLSGVQYSDKQLEFMKNILPQPEDSPTVFQGKMGSLVQHLNGLKTLKQELLQQGYKVDSKDYKEAFLSKAQNALIGSNKGGKTATQQGITETLQANPNVSREQLIQTLKSNGYTIEGEE